MVEQVEHFRAEIEARIFPGKSKMLNDGKVRVHEAGTKNRDAVRRAKEARRGGCESTWIEGIPAVPQFRRGDAVDRYTTYDSRLADQKLACGVRICCDDARFVGVSDLVRAVEIVAVAAAVEEH